jgi:hypothetical protein
VARLTRRKLTGPAGPIGLLPQSGSGGFHSDFYQASMPGSCVFRLCFVLQAEPYRRSQAMSTGEKSHAGMRAPRRRSSSMRRSMGRRRIGHYSPSRRPVWLRPIRGQGGLVRMEWTPQHGHSQITDQKVGGSSPSWRTEVPGHRVVT